MTGRGRRVADARRGDAFAVGALLLLATAATWIVAGDAASYIRGDWPTLFFPLNAFLGERLRALDIPGWNPHQFAGSPFAGDPSSGWGYLPAMALYASLPAEAAATVFIGFHVALAALAAYALARLTGLGVGGALVAGAAYACPWLIPAAGSQEYHETNVFPAGLASPLLDPLNLRSLVVPADAPRRDDLAPSLALMPMVYEDAHVRILENPAAFPRAWLVQLARQVAPGEALELLAAGAVDPRRSALLESHPPPLDASPNAAAESAAYRVSEPERLVVEAAARAPALLVLSEVWDPGWSATVDGDPAPELLANHAFRAVPVPAGRHTVELRYDPPGLRLGLGVTAATVVALAAVGVALWRRERTRASPGEP